MDYFLIGIREDNMVIFNHKVISLTTFFITTKLDYV